MTGKWSGKSQKYGGERYKKTQKARSEEGKVNRQKLKRFGTIEKLKASFSPPLRPALPARNSVITEREKD